MITEDYVSFETAKLLKEKGFDGYTHERYGLYVNGEFHRLPIDKGLLINPDIDEVYTALTHQMAMKWLREVHNIFISIVFCTYPSLNKVTWTPDITTFDSVFPESAIEYDSYEEAGEAAIKYCLENLI